MTQVFIDNNGNKHEFPDEATPEEMDAATNGSGSGGPPTGDSGAGQGSGDSASPTMFSLQHLKNVLNTVGSHTNDELRALNRGITLGGWDNVVGGVQSALGIGSPAEERQRTIEAKSRLPFNGAIPEMAGTALTTAVTGGLAPEAAAGATGVRAVPNLLTRAAGTPVAKSAATGATMSGVQAEMDRKDPSEVLTDMGIGGLFSTGMHGLTSGASRIGKWWSGTPTKPPNTAAEDLKGMTQSEWDAIKDYVYPRSALDTINTSAQDIAKNKINSVATGTPLTDTLIDKPTRKLYDRFNDRFEIVRPGKGVTGTAGTPVWPSEVDKWRSDALNLDSPHGDELANQLETLMQEGPTLKIAKLGQGKTTPLTPEQQQANTDTTYGGILAARDAASRAKAAQALDEAQKTGKNAPIVDQLHSNEDMSKHTWEVLDQANRGSVGSRFFNRANAVVPNAAAAVGPLVAGGIGLKLGGWEPATVAAISGLGLKPAAQAATQPLSDAARAKMLQAARDSLTGAMRPRPDTSTEDAFRRMLLGTWLSQQQ